MYERRMKMKKYDNIFWFLIDGLRPDFLHLGEEQSKKNYIDKTLSNATVFNNVLTAGAGTHTSMHSIFTSLLPSYNGASGWEKRALRNFKREIFTLADYFQLAGYETFRYCDTIEERAVPMSGFKRWEASGYNTGRVLENTDMVKTERRNRFIEEVNLCKKNKFIYHHIDLLHELNGELGEVWTDADYAKNVDITAREFEKLCNEYVISEKDLVIIAADHGVLLNMNHIQGGDAVGGRHYEQSVKTFFALLGEDIPAQILQEPISSLDEAPTLLHLALGTEMSINGQGKDQYDYIYNGKYSKQCFFRESSPSDVSPEKRNSMASDLFYIRDGKWKYVFSKNDSRCEWLMNLEQNQDYELNLKDQYPKIADAYRAILEEKFEEAKDFKYQSGLGFEKNELKKMFSIVLQMKHLEKETIESLLDMSGPYYEIIALDSSEIQNYKKQYNVRTVNDVETENCLEHCTGEWVVYIQDNGEWSEYFLSDLYRYIQCHRSTDVRIIGEHYTAIRKGDVKDFRGIDLYEEKEVRDMEFVHRSNIEGEKKYILFGSGKIGKKALEYFGREQVYCFADNNANLAGREIYGKKIVSFEQLKSVQDDYQIVISANKVNALAIKEQFEKNQIANFCVFEENIKKYPETCWESEYRVVWYGK